MADECAGFWHAQCAAGSGRRRQVLCSRFPDAGIPMITRIISSCSHNNTIISIGLPRVADSRYSQHGISGRWSTPPWAKYISPQRHYYSLAGRGRLNDADRRRDMPSKAPILPKTFNVNRRRISGTARASVGTSYSQKRIHAGVAEFR